MKTKGDGKRKVELKPTATGKKAKRKIGIFEGKGTVRFCTDFKMTEKEFSAFVP